MDWINWAQNRNPSKAVVKMAMNFQIFEKA